MHEALDQGAIPTKINAIPKSKFNKVLKSLLELIIPIENIITGILNKSIIRLPIEKFVLFNKFIEADIDPKQDKISDPMPKVIIKIIISLILRLKNKPAIGIEIKNGI
tara:strand:- start:762 stop:1085 length:324 start_codon:yes stop_codon:yes gene_type:complete